MRRKPLVFISSTSDLKRERGAVAEALLPTYDPYLYEEDRARGRSPQERCRQVIMQSEAFLGIVGEETGSTLDDGADSSSICEWEFEMARQRDDIQIMMMMREVDDESKLEEDQRRFRKRITDFRKGVWCRFFASTQELVQQVRQSLTTWLAEYFCQSEERRSRRRGWLGRFALASSIGGFLFLLGSVGAHLLVGLLAPSQLIGICAVSLSMILLPIVLLLAEPRGMK